MKRSAILSLMANSEPPASTTVPTDPANDVVDPAAINF